MVGPIAFRLSRIAGVLVFSALVCGIVRSQEPPPPQKARDLAAAGRVQAALDAYAAFVEEAPASRAILREAATFAFRERRWFEAARWLEQYVAFAPEDPSGWFDLGAIRHNQCRFDLAVQALRQLTALEGADQGLAARGEHRFLLGESARKLEHFGEAIAELEVAVARAPDRRDYQLAFAQALFDGGRFEAAASEFAKLAPLDPSADVFYGLGSALAESGRPDEAATALKEARRIRPGDVRTLLRLGTLATRQKDLRRAESYLIEAREAAPRNADVLFALAQAQRLSGQAEEAEQTRAAAEEAKKVADAAVERGRVFSRAVMAKPGDVEAHRHYALDLLEQGRFDDAQTVLLRLLSFDPKNELAIVNLASLLARHGDKPSALKELAKILDVDPGHEIANIQTARLRAIANDNRGAVAALQATLRRNPQNAEALQLIVGLYRALGDAETAARHEAILKGLDAAASRPPR